jgi:hypothetical protein
VGDALLEFAAGVRIVDLPPDLPKGWDLADPAPDGLDVRELIDHAERHVDWLERLVEEAEADPGAPFESEAVDFLAALRDRDKAAYERAPASRRRASGLENSTRRWSGASRRRPARYFQNGTTAQPAESPTFDIFKPAVV